MTMPNTQQKSFLASLFDFGFTSFITLRFLKVIYAVFVVLIILAGVVFLLLGLASGRAAGVLLGIVGAPLITLLYLVMARVYMEFIAMFFRIGDNSALTVQLLSANAGLAPGNLGAPSRHGAPPFPAATYPAAPQPPAAGAQDWGPPAPTS
jgi:hypothetical protein